MVNDEIPLQKSLETVIGALAKTLNEPCNPRSAEMLQYIRRMTIRDEKLGPSTTFTCDSCRDAPTCWFAFDEFNLQNKCLRDA